MEHEMPWVAKNCLASPLQPGHGKISLWSIPCGGRLGRLQLGLPQGVVTRHSARSHGCRTIGPCHRPCHQPAPFLGVRPKLSGKWLYMSPPESTDEAAPQQRSARQRLIEWANQQDGWARSIAAEVISTRREVSAEALNAVRNAYLVEKQLSPGEVPGRSTPRRRRDERRRCRGAPTLQAQGVRRCQRLGDWPRDHVRPQDDGALGSRCGRQDRVRAHPQTARKRPLGREDDS